MSVPPGLPVFWGEIFSHLDHGFLTFYLGSFSGYLHSFVCLVWGFSLGKVLSLIFSHSIFVCLVKDFFEFIFSEILEPVSLYLPQIWELFSQYFFKYFFCTMFFFPSFWDSDYMNVGAFLLSHWPLRFCSLFLHVWCSEWIIPIDLSSSSLTLSSFIFNPLVTPSVTFLFQWLYSSVLKLPFGPSLYLLSLHWDFLIFPFVSRVFALTP